MPPSKLLPVELLRAIIDTVIEIDSSSSGNEWVKSVSALLLTSKETRNWTIRKLKSQQSPARCERMYLYQLLKACELQEESKCSFEDRISELQDDCKAWRPNGKLVIDLGDAGKELLDAAAVAPFEVIPFWVRQMPCNQVTIRFAQSNKAYRENDDEALNDQSFNAKIFLGNVCRAVAESFGGSLKFIMRQLSSCESQEARECKYPLQCVSFLVDNSRYISFTQEHIRKSLEEEGIHEERIPDMILSKYKESISRSKFRFGDEISDLDRWLPSEIFRVEVVEKYYEWNLSTSLLGWAADCVQNEFWNKNVSSFEVGFVDIIGTVAAVDEVIERFCNNDIPSLNDTLAISRSSMLWMSLVTFRVTIRLSKTMNSVIDKVGMHERSYVVGHLQIDLIIEVA